MTKLKRVYRKSKTPFSSWNIGRNMKWPWFPQLDTLFFSIKKFIIIICVTRDTPECSSGCWTSCSHDLCTDTPSKYRAVFSFLKYSVFTLFLSALYLSPPTRLSNLKLILKKNDIGTLTFDLRFYCARIAQDGRL